ncbi:MAG: type II toxin-antitoxin system RelE/ParE family toxin [Bacteroidetes bacterium]|nr:type II toxin-antitoxin system RelE/ParE family toxin [Bacteroidota bacterium]
MSYKIVFANSVRKDIRKIPVSILKNIKSNINELANFPNISNFKRLSSCPFADYRLRVGDYRILFDIDYMNNEIIILKIGHRKDVY